MKTLILNSTNVVSNGYNDTYKYSFPVGSVSFKNDQIAVLSVNMYYSWFNINSTTYGNNTFAYKFNGTTYTVSLPNGFYSASDINNYLQLNYFIPNKQYLIDSTGNYVYFLTIATNATYYAIQITSFPIIDSSQVNSLKVVDANSPYYGYTVPASFPYATNSSSRYCPQFVITSTAFGKLFGFTTGSYPSSATTTSTQVNLSSFTPQISPVSSLVMTCSLLHNKFSNPSTLLYSFSSGSTSFGSIFSAQPSGQLPFVDVQDGTYNDFTIQFFDQDLNRVAINDNNLIILLVVQNKTEMK